MLSGSEFHTGTPAFMLTDVLHSTSLKRDSQISLRVQDLLFSPKFSGNFLLIYPLIQGPSGFPSLILKQFRARVPNFCIGESAYVTQVDSDTI